MTTRTVTVYGFGGFDPTKPNGNVIDSYTEEVPPSPLDSTGALATLLAVEGVLSVQDAANAVGLIPEDLIAEAEAWAVASGDSNGS